MKPKNPFIESMPINPRFVGRGMIRHYQPPTPSDEQVDAEMKKYTGYKSEQEALPENNGGMDDAKETE